MSIKVAIGEIRLGNSRFYHLSKRRYVYEEKPRIQKLKSKQLAKERWNERKDQNEKLLQKKVHEFTSRGIVLREKYLKYGGDVSDNHYKNIRAKKSKE